MKTTGKITISIILVITILLLSNNYCTVQNKTADNLLDVVLITPQPTLEPTPSPTVRTTPKLTSSPTPIPTKTPFSVLAPTTQMSFEELFGDNGDYTEYKNIPSPPPSDTYKIRMSIFSQVIIIYEKDENGDFTVPAMCMLCATGTEDNPTPVGEFQIGEDRARFTNFTEYENSYAQYWTQLVDDYYFHSVLYKARDENSLKDSYSQLGNRISHGCIRLFVPDARWIWYNIAPGTQVEIFEEEDKYFEQVRQQLISSFPFLDLYQD